MYKDWKIGEIIGEGGQAQVYLATRADDDGTYALKRFKNPKREERSKTEILNMRNLRSLGVKVPEIIDNGEYKEGRPYFVTKFYKNKSLEDNIFTLANNIDRIEFSKMLCKEIRKMNAAGFVHRDLKPANILLDESFNPIICDYGLSHSIEKKSGLSMTGEPIGSVHYIHPGAYDTRSVSRKDQVGFDGYSFAKIFYIILTGKQLLGYAHAQDSSLFIDTISDEYIAGKVMRLINRLLNQNINELAAYWNKFPTELLAALRPPTEIEELDKSTASNIRSLFMNRLNSLPVDPNQDEILMEDVTEEIIKAIKESKAIALIDQVCEENDNKERVQVKEKINLREILEGVGVKSNYGVASLTAVGRKQSLVSMEIAIVPPFSKIQIGVSIVSNAPKIIVLLCVIRKSGPWIDIDEDTVKKIVIDNEKRADGLYLKDMVDFIQQVIGE